MQAILNFNSILLETMIWGVLGLLGAWLLWYILWGLKIKYDTRNGEILIKVWDKKTTQTWKNYVRLPDEYGYVTIQNMKYKTDTTISKSRENWPGGAPSILQVSMPISYHLLNAEEAISLDANDYSKITARSATEAALKDSEHVWHWLIDIAKKALSGSKEKFLSTTNILIMVGIFG